MTKMRQVYSVVKQSGVVSEYCRVQSIETNSASRGLYYTAMLFASLLNAFSKPKMQVHLL